MNPQKSYRVPFILSLLVSAGGLLGIFACRTMAKEAYFYVWFVGCSAYWVLIPLFFLGLLAAAFFCFCKKAAPPLPFGLAAMLALVYTVLLLLPTFRYWFTGTAYQAIHRQMPQEAVLQKAMLCDIRDLSSYPFTEEEFPQIEALLQQVSLDTALPNRMIQGEGWDFIDCYWLLLTYYTPENRTEYWNITLSIPTELNPAATIRTMHINGYQQHDETPELLCYTGSPGLYQIVEQFQDKITPFE